MAELADRWWHAQPLARPTGNANRCGVTWVLEGDHQRCERHDTTFTKLDCCPACENDPGPAAQQAELEVLDPDAAADEQWCRDQRDVLMAAARDAAGQQGQVTEQPTEPGAADGEEQGGWFFWRGKWRPVDPPKGADVGLSTVAKLADTALKFHRAAVDERRRRGERDHDRWLVKQARQLKQIGVIN